MRFGRSLFVGFAAAIVSLAMSGGAFAMDQAVNMMTKDGVGSYLADPGGMTLYWFAKDSPGKSACEGPCVEKWPIFYQEKVAAGDGTKDGDFGTITREDGKKQTTFRGYPLYFWVGDKAKGDTGGDGINNVWHVIDPGNFPPSK